MTTVIDSLLQARFECVTGSTGAAERVEDKRPTIHVHSGSSPEAIRWSRSHVTRTSAEMMSGSTCHVGFSLSVIFCVEMIGDVISAVVVHSSVPQSGDHSTVLTEICCSTSSHFQTAKDKGVYCFFKQLWALPTNVAVEAESDLWPIIRTAWQFWPILWLLEIRLICQRL